MYNGIVFFKYVIYKELPFLFMLLTKIYFLIELHIIRDINTFTLKRTQHEERSEDK